MPVLPDIDALALSTTLMFEKPDPVSISRRRPSGGFRSDEHGPMRRSAPAARSERFDERGLRRAGDALRAVEWSEITARLNAARDLRLLLRHESQAPIEASAASFGDAAASYFALLDHCEPEVNLDALGQSKVLGAKRDVSDVKQEGRLGRAAGETSAAVQSDARETE